MLEAYATDTHESFTHVSRFVGLIKSRLNLDLQLH